MRKLTLVVTVSIAAVSTSSLPAQQGSAWYRGSGGSVQSFSQYYVPAAASPEAGIAHGAADMIRAAGHTNLMNSEALINIEEARTRYADNAVKWTRAYYQRKQLYRDWKMLEAERDREIREVFRSRFNTRAVPELGPEQLDLATGYVNWPNALKDSQFADERRGIEELLVLKAHTSSTPDLSRRIHAAARVMQEGLKERIRDIPAVEYIPARRFLDGLAFAGYNSP